MSKANPAISHREASQLPPEKLVGIIIAQQNQINQLHQEIERLKGSLNLDSQTSSKPPSTDLLKKSEKAKQQQIETETPSEKRRPGGQPGHQGKTRKGFGRVDRYVIIAPEICPNCGKRELSQEGVKVETQQVAQLVERPIEIVEYQRHHCQCLQCGGIAVEDWSAQILPGQDIGVRLQALLVWLGNYGHLSYAKQQELLWELGKIEIGQGTLVATNKRVEGAIAGSVKQLKEWIIQAHPNLHSDETPWLVKGVKEWLWVLAGVEFCLFHAGDTRSRGELESILGFSYDGVLISDDFSVYNGYPVKGQQKCLAHLRRHFQRLSQTKGKNNQVIAQTFLKLINEAFEQHRVWRETANERQYRSWAQGFQERVSESVSDWLTSAGYEAGKLLRSLRNMLSGGIF